MAYATSTNLSCVRLLIWITQSPTAVPLLLGALVLLLSGSFQRSRRLSYYLNLIRLLRNAHLCERIVKICCDIYQLNELDFLTDYTFRNSLHTHGLLSRFQIWVKCNYEGYIFHKTLVRKLDNGAAK